MKTDYKSIYKGKADDDLIVIAVLDKALFLPEALEAAREELISRGIDPDAREALDAAERIDKHRNRFKEKKEEFRGAAKAVWANKVVASPSIQNALESKRTSERCSISDNESVNAYQAAWVILRAIGLFLLIPRMLELIIFVGPWVLGPNLYDFGSEVVAAFTISMLFPFILIIFPRACARIVLRLDPLAAPIQIGQVSPQLFKEIFAAMSCFLIAIGFVEALFGIFFNNQFLGPINETQVFADQIEAAAKFAAIGLTGIFCALRTDLLLKCFTNINVGLSQSLLKNSTEASQGGNMKEADLFQDDGRII
ncbi:hypothetical protein [Desulfatibacillum aliphaticivorans]|uniref:hypothetical protein n=1 Tax=Desulfatibacillum aliphaticivorans TaxID=218208 RepID=UPI00040E0D39|nr:hypothetical protein [Desulfatibacillum aliphaticivorans]